MFNKMKRPKEILLNKINDVLEVIDENGGNMNLYYMEQIKVDHYSFMEIERIQLYGKT